ncbi:hypothetical protein AX760_23290 [Pararhizobium antarcticum]|uniref:Uncharacterized protein n=1 Tax=Pararhizobium antarcticum TaxID=1798805 RepID=A0A657LLR6_9HYPH|nr:hypothetical protein AX760_23290 [Pararhizobium antarcticum]
MKNLLNGFTNDSVEAIHLQNVIQEAKIVCFRRAYDDERSHNAILFVLTRKTSRAVPRIEETLTGPPICRRSKWYRTYSFGIKRLCRLVCRNFEVISSAQPKMARAGSEPFSG